MTVDRDVLGDPVLQVAPLLLGALLTSDVGGVTVTVRVTEVEAYEGAGDPASHAYRGRTSRTAVMFGPPGHLYCYFVYGMHWCANIVTGPDGVASAVLLRAGQPIDLIEPAVGVPAARRPQLLASGPARLARTLALNGSHTGLDLLDPASPVRLSALGPEEPYRSGPRVGVSTAVERPWRFWLPDEQSVSKYRPGGRKRGPTTGQTEQP